MHVNARRPMECAEFPAMDYSFMVRHILIDLMRDRRDLSVVPNSL